MKKTALKAFQETSQPRSWTTQPKSREAEVDIRPNNFRVGVTKNNKEANVQLQFLFIEKSTVSTERQRITPLPGTATGAANHLVESVTLAHSTVFTASGSQATQLTMLMDWFADPVDSGVTADSFVEWIYHYNFKVLVCGIVGDPVRVKHPQAATVSTSTLLKERRFHWILFNTFFLPVISFSGDKSQEVPNPSYLF